VNFVFCTDPHVTNIKPRSRVDNYYETIMRKLDWVVNFTNENNAHLLLGGDIVDSYTAHPEVVNKIAQSLSLLKKQAFSIIGNHDIYGHNYEVINQVILGTLYNSGLLKLLTMTPLVISDGKLNIQLSGANYVPDIDSRKDLYSINKLPGVNCAIHLIHGFLVNKNWPEFDHSQYTTVQEVVTQADVVCSGHEHHGYGIETVNNVIYTNPGAAGRIHASVGEMSRVPKISLINCYADRVDVSLVPIPCALGTEVMSREHIIAEKEKQQRLGTFTDALQTQMLACDINAVFEQQAKTLGIETSVRVKAIEAYRVYDEARV